MGEPLFWIIYCKVCHEISVVDELKEDDDHDTLCPKCECKDGVLVKTVTASTFKDFMISTTAQLWQLFGKMSSSWR